MPDSNNPLPDDHSGDERATAWTAQSLRAHLKLQMKLGALRDRDDCSIPVHRTGHATRMSGAFAENELDDPQLLASAAAEIYRMRRARDRIMPPGLTGEPAWDILLALYSEEPSELTVSSVCYGSGVPPTTASRWIGVLTARGLVERKQHPRDDRVILVSLTANGRLVVERSLRAMLRSRNS
jgi:DNA-binding MarR family transcriptional regulator